ncbi:glycosyltransferase [Paenibacillus sp. SYP-B3998]|uniref:Glycosyltransferase n=1 Tax=Paenibacillus sp. SYP-B3998 TaxID=2678564 RepID=A0A6G3ZZG5_9BACL|nr:glycosyltransferase [Paenibacillus sp. SYP-B3998]NEW07084.1 glycosyltransferase [Paenibacillus sp. SYP-B3998]
MKIGYIDHSFHQKTLSSQFFVDILKKNGLEVEYIWDYSWKGGKPVNLEELVGTYDAFVFHQLSAVASRPYYKLPVNITYLPMLDNFGNDQLFHFNRHYWKHYAGVKILCFSKALNSAILSHGLASKYVKYFPDPSKFIYTENEDDLRGFFWQRAPEQINWEIIKKLVQKADFSSMHIHTAVDPGLQPYHPSVNDIRDFKISTSEWFPERKDLYKIIAANQVYFTPRPSEGIGMSFLEAMAMGKCVVSPDYGTMNEYIIHGINGLLYNLNDPKPLDFKNVKEISKLARKSVEIGYEQWLEKEQEIINFIVEPPNKVYSVYYPNGYNYDDIAQVNTINENQQLEYSDINKVSSIQRMKRYVASSKAAPFLRPVWRLMKETFLTVNKTEKVDVNVEITRETLSTTCNISNQSIDFPLGGICGKFSRSETDKNKIICEGGIRLKGEYKKTIANKPLVTIITVVRNRAKKLERAMLSVFNQTYDNVEYIIVDGGSTDETVDIIKRYENGIDYYVSEPDKGIYNAINKGLSFASGDYIGILNSDDWYTSDAIELSVKQLTEEDADYSGAEEYVINEDGSIVGIYELKPFSNIALWAQNPCNHGTMFISRKAYEAIGLYDENYRIAADYKMQLLLVTNTDLKSCTVKKPIHYYEVAGLSSVERDKTLGEVKEILKFYHKNLTDKHLDSLIDFMHDFKMNESIINDLEEILNMPDYSMEQRRYLLNRMITYGYKEKLDLISKI